MAHEDFTEEQWLTNTSARFLLSFPLWLRRTDRKMRLFAAACCRRLWHIFGDLEQGRRAVEVAERTADGLAGTDELKNVQAAVEQALGGPRIAQQFDTPFGAAGLACQAAMRAAAPDWRSKFDARKTVFLATEAIAHFVTRGNYSWHEERRKWRQDPQGWEASEDQLPTRIEEACQCVLLRCIFGNPFRPLPQRTFSAHVQGLAQSIYDGEHLLFSILADALEDLGEGQAAAHCRDPAHAKGCHVIDWILNKE